MSNSSTYKKRIKVKIRDAHKYLKAKQQQHSKIKNIEYDTLQRQAYMQSPIFSNEEVNLLYALRSRSTECKANFKQKYIHTNILCTLCGVESEDQQHLLKCQVIKNNFKTEEISNGSVKYEDIFSKDVQKQKEVTALYMNLFRLRDSLLEEENSQMALAPPEWS